MIPHLIGFVKGGMDGFSLAYNKPAQKILFAGCLAFSLLFGKIILLNTKT